MLKTITFLQAVTTTQNLQCTQHEPVKFLWWWAWRAQNQTRKGPEHDQSPCWWFYTRKRMQHKHRLHPHSVNTHMHNAVNRFLKSGVNLKLADPKSDGHPSFQKPGRCLKFQNVQHWHQESAISKSALAQKIRVKSHLKAVACHLP